MAKRYILQIMTAPATEDTPEVWENVKFPGSDSDWMTRRYNTALNDAAKLVATGVVERIRVVLSTPVTTYEIAEAISYEEIANAADAFDSESADDDDDDALTVTEAEVDEQVALAKAESEPIQVDETDPEFKNTLAGN